MDVVELVDVIIKGGPEALILIIGAVMILVLWHYISLVKQVSRDVTDFKHEFMDFRITYVTERVGVGDVDRLQENIEKVDDDAGKALSRLEDRLNIHIAGCAEAMLRR